MDDEEQEAQAFAQSFSAEPTVTPAPVEPAPPEIPEPEYVQITKSDYERISQAIARLPELEQQLGRKVDTAFGKIGVIEQGLRQGGGALTEEDLEPFKELAPELMPAMLKLRSPANLEALLEERTKPYAERLDQVTAELRETQTDTVAAVHPDWAEFSRTPEYSAWLATKDDAYREKLNNTWAPRAIVSALTEAKQFAAKSKPRSTPQNTRQAIVQAAVQPRGTGGRYIGGSQEATEQDAYAKAWAS